MIEDEIVILDKSSQGIQRPVSAPLSQIEFPIQKLLARREFFSEIELLMSFNQKFFLLALKVINQDGLNEQYGYIETEKLIESMLPWIIEVISQLVMPGNFSISKVESDTFFISLHDDVSREHISLIIDQLLQVGAGKDHQTISMPPSLIQLTAGLGVYPETGDTLNQLINSTVASLAKFSSSNHLYGDSLAHAMAFSLYDIKTAINQNQFQLWYQPKVNLKTKEVVGVEALIRWNHPELGILLPPYFLNWVNMYGLMGELNKWIIDTGFSKCREFLDSGNEITVAMNLDASCLLDKNSLLSIQNAQLKYKVPPRLIEFEIVETVGIRKGEKALEVLSALKSRGYQISIDDFGTGMSNISYLMYMPANIVKLDRMFSSRIDDERMIVLTKAAIEMASIVEMTVVAEGIETKEQHEAMLELGCDIGQGYFFGRPTPDYSL